MATSEPERENAPDSDLTLEQDDELESLRAKVANLQEALLRSQAETSLVKKSCVVLLREKQNALELVENLTQEKQQLTNEVARQRMLLEEMQQQRENLATNAQFLARMSRFKDENETLQQHLKQAQDRLDAERTRFAVREAELESTIQQLRRELEQLQQQAVLSVRSTTTDPSAPVAMHLAFDSRIRELEQTNLKLSQGLAECEQRRSMAKAEVLQLSARLERERRQWLAAELALRLEATLTNERLRCLEEMLGLESSSSSSTISGVPSSNTAVSHQQTSPTSPSDFTSMSPPFSAQDMQEIATRQAVVINEVSFDAMDGDFELGHPVALRSGPAQRPKLSRQKNATLYPSQALTLSMGLAAKTDARMHSTGFVQACPPSPLLSIEQKSQKLPGNPLYRDFGFTFEQLAAIDRLGLDPTGASEVNADLDDLLELVPIIPLDAVEGDQLTGVGSLSPVESMTMDSVTSFRRELKQTALSTTALDRAVKKLEGLQQESSTTQPSPSLPNHVEMRARRPITLEAAVAYHLALSQSRLSKLEHLMVWFERCIMEQISKKQISFGSSAANDLLEKVFGRMKVHLAIAIYASDEARQFVLRWRGHRRRLQLYLAAAVRHLRQTGVVEDAAALTDLQSAREEIYQVAIDSILSCGNLCRLMCSKLFSSCQPCCSSACCSSTYGGTSENQSFVRRMASLLGTVASSIVSSSLDAPNTVESLHELQVYNASESVGAELDTTLSNKAAERQFDNRLERDPPSELASDHRHIATGLVAQALKEKGSL